MRRAWAGGPAPSSETACRTYDSRWLRIYAAEIGGKLMVLMATTLVLLLAQTGESPDRPAADDRSGKFLLAVCGNYTGDDTPTPATTNCLAYVAGLTDSIAVYEARLMMLWPFDILIHAGFFARVGELPPGLLDTLRNNPMGVGIAKIQDEAIAKGAARSTPVFSDLKPTSSVVQPAICFPEGVSSTGQVALVIVKFVRDHPERLHEHRGVLAFAALESAFPCPEEDATAALPGQPPVGRRP